MPHHLTIVVAAWSARSVEGVLGREGAVEITRRQLLGGALGLVGAGLLEACGSPPTGFSFVQSTEGVRVTTGRSIAVRYAHPVQTGSLLVAVVTRSSSSTLAPTIGQVSDDAR